MRKVVKQADSEVIDLDRIDNNSKLIVKWSNGDSYSLIIKGTDEKFYGMNCAYPDLTHSWKADSKREYASRAIDQKGTEVFEFNTYKELYEWLSQQ